MWSAATPTTPNEIATPEIGRLAGIARECGVEEQVTFVGRRGAPAIALLLQRGRRVRDDAVVRAVRHHTARGDGLRHGRSSVPMSAASAIRLPIGETGLLVPPKDPAALAHASISCAQTRPRARATAWARAGLHARASRCSRGAASANRSRRSTRACGSMPAKATEDRVEKPREQARFADRRRAALRRMQRRHRVSRCGASLRRFRSQFSHCTSSCCDPLYFSTKTARCSTTCPTTSTPR